MKKVLFLSFVSLWLVMGTMCSSETSSKGNPEKKDIQQKSNGQMIRDTTDNTSKSMPASSESDSESLARPESKDSKRKETNAIQAKDDEIPAAREGSSSSSFSGFINTNLGQKMKPDQKGELNSLASEDVYLERKGVCLTDACGKKVELVNLNEQKSIEVLVQITWKEGSSKQLEMRKYILQKDSRQWIGCTKSCEDENVEIKWSLVGAVYL